MTTTTTTTTTTQPQQSEEPLLLTTELLLHRLHSGLGIAGGARGSLTKAASKRSVTDLELQQLELTKLLLTSRRQEAELAGLEQHAQAQQQQAETSQSPSSSSIKSIPELRSELARLEQVQSCLQEYEALAKLTVGRHAVSEHQLQQDIRAMEVHHALAVQERQQLTAACHVRQNQFHALQQCLQDLQQSLQEQPLTLHPHELARVPATAAEDDDDDVMDIDEGESRQQQRGDTNMEEDEGKLLYGDL